MYEFKGYVLFNFYVNLSNYETVTILIVQPANSWLPLKLTQQDAKCFAQY